MCKIKTFENIARNDGTVVAKSAMFKSFRYKNRVGFGVVKNLQRKKKYELSPRKKQILFLEVGKMHCIIIFFELCSKTVPNK